MEPPTRVSKIIHRHSKAVAVMITKKLSKVNWDSHKERSELASWLNGVAIPETNPDAKREIKALRSQVQSYGSE